MALIAALSAAGLSSCSSDAGELDAGDAVGRLSYDTINLLTLFDVRPDGRRVLLNASTDVSSIIEVDLETGSVRMLAESDGTRPRDAGYTPNSLWFRDASSIVIETSAGQAVFPPPGSIADRPPEIVTARDDTIILAESFDVGLYRHRPSDGLVRIRDEADVAFSVNEPGQRYLYGLDSNGAWVYDVDGDQFYPAPDLPPNRTANGDRFYFISSNGDVELWTPDGVVRLPSEPLSDVGAIGTPLCGEAGGQLWARGVDFDDPVQQLTPRQSIASVVEAGTDCLFTVDGRNELIRLNAQTGESETITGARRVAFFTPSVADFGSGRGLRHAVWADSVLYLPAGAVPLAFSNGPPLGSFNQISVNASMTAGLWYNAQSRSGYRLDLVAGTAERVVIADGVAWMFASPNGRYVIECEVEAIEVSPGISFDRCRANQILRVLDLETGLSRPLLDRPIQGLSSSGVEGWITDEVALWIDVTFPPPDRLDDPLRSRLWSLRLQ